MSATAEAVLAAIWEVFGPVLAQIALAGASLVLVALIWAYSLILTLPILLMAWPVWCLALLLIAAFVHAPSRHTKPKLENRA